MMTDWDERFLMLAEHISRWSKDPSTKVGAVIVRPDKTVASLGFNGFPRGVEDSEDRYTDRAIKYPMVVHAELNAILTASEPLKGFTIYTPLFPCANCAASIIQAGIQRVVTRPIPDEFNERWKDSIGISRMMFYESDVAISTMITRE